MRDGMRFLPNEHFVEIIGGIVRGLEHHGLAARISVFSEGDEDEFQELLLQTYSKVVLQLHQSMLEAWTRLVAADIVVLSHSSFSYSAALYSEGLAVYSTFWHSPMPSWLTFHDRDQLATAISQQHVGVLLRKKMSLRQSAPESI